MVVSSKEQYCFMNLNLASHGDVCACFHDNNAPSCQRESDYYHRALASGSTSCPCSSHVHMHSCGKKTLCS